MIIKCPHCAHQGKIDEARIPPQGANVKCPSCRGSFAIRRPEMAQQPPGGQSAAATASQPAATSGQEPVAQPREPEQPAGLPEVPSPAPGQPSDPSEPALGFKGGPVPVTGQPQQPSGGGGLSFKNSPPQAAEIKTVACGGCLKLFNENDLVESGDRKLCQSCQEAFRAKGQTPMESRAAQRLTPSARAKLLRFKYGGFWIRFGAYLVDVILLLLVWQFVLGPILIKVSMNMFSETALPAAMSLPQDTAMDPAQMEAALAQMQDAMNTVSNRMMTWMWVVQIIGVLFFAGYFVILEGGPGQTIGKKALGLRVVSADGERIGILKAVARHIGKIIGFLILGIGFIMAAFDSEKRALHDRMIDSRVVRE